MSGATYDVPLATDASGLPDGEPRFTVLRVDGMMSQGCVKRVAEAINTQPSAAEVSVDLHSGLATLFFAEDVDTLIAAIRDIAHRRAEPVTQRAVVLFVDGMTCESCVRRVTQALGAVPSATEVVVDLRSGIVTLSYAGEDDALITAVRDVAQKMAFVVARRLVVLNVQGMTCNGCVRRVADALRALPSAECVQVDLEAGTASLLYAGDDEWLVKAIFESAGKKASTVVGPQDDEVVSSPQLCDEELEIDGNTISDGTRNALDDMSGTGKAENTFDDIPGTSEVSISFAKNLAAQKQSGDVSRLLGGGGGTAEEEASLAEHRTNVGAVEDYEQWDELSLATPPVSPAVLELGSSSSESQRTQSSFKDGKSANSFPVTTHLRVRGMTCSSCVGIAEEVLKGVKGVQSVSVNLLAGRASILHEDGDGSTDRFIKAFNGSGYSAELLSSNSSQFETSGEGKSVFRIDFPMEVQAQNASRMLRILADVDSASASGFTTTVTLKQGATKATILHALETNGGFGKMLVRSSVRAEREAEEHRRSLSLTEVIDEEAHLWGFRFKLSLVFFVPIVLLGFLEYAVMVTFQWIQFPLATVVQFVCGAGFYRRSYLALRKGRASMDVLVALSTSIAYFSSVVVLLFGLVRTSSSSLGHSTMFRVSSMIITMVLLGKWLEAVAKRRAAQGVTALLALTPDHAVLYNEKERVALHTEVPVGVLQMGDVVRLNAGDRVPVDSEVVEGSSAVDESMLTGESKPVPKGCGDHVYGGTVNGSGAMLVRATAVGADAVLLQIVKLVGDAQTARAPVEAFADRVSAVFVPAVVVFSIVVFVVWYSAAVLGFIPEEWYAEEGKFFFALLFALETMVITCPCALGLATPTAVKVACEVGTRFGVLFRGGAATVQAANEVKTVIFDKTGTLTNGRPEVSAIVVGKRGCDEVEQASVLLSDVVLLVESQSNHPLAAAISRYIRDSLPTDLTASGFYKISEFEEVPGRGVKATLNQGEYRVRIGSLQFAFEGADRSKLLTDAEMKSIDRLGEEEGLTLVAAVINEVVVCVYGLEDAIRPEAPKVIKTLHAMGIDTALLTGDSVECGRAVALRCGIASHRVHASAMPWTKVSVVEAEAPACFVGDGINDAPALVAATVGIAIGAGAPVAAESAPVVLVRSNLRGVVDAIDLARATFRRVRLNFFWAVGYNIIGIPIAAGFLFPLLQHRLPPLVASGAMALSSACVVLSSSALRWYRPMSIEEPEERGAVGERRFALVGASSDDEPTSQGSKVALLGSRSGDV